MDLDVDQLLLCIYGYYFDKHISGNIMGISFALKPFEAWNTKGHELWSEVFLLILGVPKEGN